MQSSDGLSAQMWTSIGAIAMLAGLALLRLIWGRREYPARVARAVTWIVIVAGGTALSRALGGEVGSASALLAFSVLAYAVVAAGIELRQSPRRMERGLALEPESRSTGWSRGLTKALLAILLAGIAAMGIGLAFAVAAPISPSDRIVIGGLLVPVLWGAGMAWTLADAKLLRATILIVLVAALSFGVAFLSKALKS